MSRALRAARAAAPNRWPLLALCLCLGACRTLTRPQAPPAPAPIPVTPAVQPLHYRIDPAQSQVLILVYRDGPMAKLGHNHVLSVKDLSGEVTSAGEPSQERFWLEFPVAAISIDELALRAAAGDEFKTSVDAESIAGTRAHMLGAQLLDADHYPTIRLQSEQLRADGDRWLATVHIRVRDHDSTAEVPMTLMETPEQLDVSGEFDLTHTQLGLTPYSVALGALRVAETLHVRYRLVAPRATESGADPQHP
jgi:YceI-like protein